MNFEKITLRKQVSHRGGGIEISLDTLGWPGVKMTAYQNYLGGGLLGSIQNGCTIRDWENSPQLKAIADELCKYWYNLISGEVYEPMSFEQIQRMPKSAY